MKTILVIITIYFIIFFIPSCKNTENNKANKISTDNISDIEKGEIVSVPQKVEIVGKDDKGADIKKELSENEEVYIEVIVNNNITLTGEIAVLGSSMFNDLVLITKDKETYTFKPQCKEEYWKYQGNTIFITCKIEKRKITDKKTGKILKKYWLYPIKINK